MTKQLSMTPDAMRQHVLDLAAAFNVHVQMTSIAPDRAAAHFGLRVVVCHPVIDETTYAVALHELGHLCAPLGAVRAAHVDGDLGNLHRIEEAAAWEWARYHALYWSDVMEHVATWAEGTYQSTTPVDDPPAPVAPNQRINWNDWK